MHVVKVLLADKVVSLLAQDGENLYALLAKEHIPVEASCGGNGTCGKCRVQLVEGELGEPGEQERKKLGNLIEEQSLRLACLCQMRQDITINPILNLGEAQIMTGGNFDAAATDGEAGCGLAVDIGTTTVAAFLMDLAAGKMLRMKSGLNAQRIHGSDVIARCGYAIDHEGGVEKMQGLIIGQLNELAHALVEESGLQMGDIRRVCLAGNPAMMHLAAALPVNSIAVAPYSTQYHKGFARGAASLGFGMADDVSVYFLPVISGYVGADTIAACMAAEQDQQNSLTLLIDIGTNGEIVLGNRDRLVACAAAAGPAFEGGKIACGIGGIEGAVDSFFDRNGPAFTTIGNKPAKGICGSGLVDLLAVLTQKGCIDETGVLSNEDCRDQAFARRFGDEGFVLARAAEGAERDVYLTQRDVREVQLAKSAIASGIEILMMRLGVSADDIETVYLAGGFGSYIDYNSACMLGLIPAALREKIVGIGNAAGTGARQCVCSAAQRRRADDLCERIQYIELAEAKEFSDAFMENMMFPGCGDGYGS